MRKMFLMISVMVVLLPFAGLSQLLKGKVIGEAGTAAAGVTIQSSNKSRVTTTNADGSFKITLTKVPDTLIFFAVGFESYRFIVTDKNIKDPNFEVVLLNKRSELSEVVVTGYAAAKKADMTGSVSSVPAEREIKGSVAGFSKSYRPDHRAPVRIRGTSTVDDEISTPSSLSKPMFYADVSVLPAKDAAGGLRIPTAASSILTAGEVNDFNKWKMWEDYTESEFKTWSDYWGMLPKNRYSVQLTDKNHNAIIDEPLFLLNKSTKDTVWRAFTDNTGKAELWAGLFKRDEAGQEFVITDKNGNRLDHPSNFENGVNLLSANKACGFSNDADIAFVVDATGSMGDEIEYLKLELEDVLRKTTDKYSSLTLHAASVFYRDQGDLYLTRHVDFNDDLLKAINFIKLQNAGGGGDYPEAVDDALATALDSLKWNGHSRTKLLFLVLDAPAHEYAKERMRQLTVQAAMMGIRIIPIACSGTDKSTEFLLRSMALATNGTYAFLTDHSGVGNKHIEPTTDKYEVELLNGLLQRIIGQFLYAKDCSKGDTVTNEVDTRQPDNILSLKLYPNPTSGQFTIESNKDIRELYITDFTGKILMRLESTAKKGRWKADLSQYPSAMYLVKYITKENKWGAEKIVMAR